MRFRGLALLCKPYFDIIFNAGMLEPRSGAWVYRLASNRMRHCPTP